ncbi:MAG TPA: DUF2382 domain-containing protein [Chloroflexia bacterium]|nr:DUF2382 domain-containing protein [Chloroflexia bacterium]
MSNRTMQRETVVGVFNERGEAQRAIEALKAAGFRGDDIGILMQNRDQASEMAEDTGTKAGEGAAAGATTGGLLGGLAGLLVGLGALAIPGIGPVLAAGPLAAALGPVIGATATGAVLGAGTGALVGALVGMGIPEEEARVYEQHFNEGRILVTVKSGAGRYNEAEQILRRAGAQEIDFGQAGAGRTQTSSYAQGTTGGTQTQSSSYAQGTTSGRTQSTGNTADQLRVPVVEESLNVQKAARQAGEVEIRKNVVEEQVNVPVQLSHEEVTVTRHAVDRPLQAGERTLDDGEVIRVPVNEETAQVTKQARVTGEVEINKQRVTEQRNVSDTVRKEVVDVDTVGGVESQGSGRSGSSRTSNTSGSSYINSDLNTETPYDPNTDR